MIETCNTILPKVVIINISNSCDSRVVHDRCCFEYNLKILHNFFFFSFPFLFLAKRFILREVHTVGCRHVVTRDIVISSHATCMHMHEHSILLHAQVNIMYKKLISCESQRPMLENVRGFHFIHFIYG